MGDFVLWCRWTNDRPDQLTSFYDDRAPALPYSHAIGTILLADHGVDDGRYVIEGGAAEQSSSSSRAAGPALRRQPHGLRTVRSSRMPRPRTPFDQVLDSRRRDGGTAPSSARACSRSGASSATDEAARAGVPQAAATRRCPSRRHHGRNARADAAQEEHTTSCRALGRWNSSGSTWSPTPTASLRPRLLHARVRDARVGRGTDAASTTRPVEQRQGLRLARERSRLRPAASAPSAHGRGAAGARAPRGCSPHLTGAGLRSRFSRWLPRPLVVSESTATGGGVGRRDVEWSHVTGDREPPRRPTRGRPGRGRARQLPDVRRSRSRPGSSAEVDGKVPVVLSIHSGPEAQGVRCPARVPVPARPASASWRRTSAARPATASRPAARAARLGRRRHAGLGARGTGSRSRTGSTRNASASTAARMEALPVSTCVTRLPDYWAAAVDIFGPSNLVTFAKAVRRRGSASSRASSAIRRPRRTS